MQTPIGEMWMDDDVLIHRIDQVVVSEDAARGVHEAVKRLTGGTAVPAVVDLREVGYASRDARDMFAAPPEGANESATALVVRSRASQVMASLFMKFSRPDRPVKVFHSDEPAIEWARSFVESDR